MYQFITQCHCRLRAGWGRRLLLAALVLLLGLQAGCSTMKTMGALFGSDNKPIESAESLAQRGLDKYNHGKYSDALELFNQLKSQYPFGNYALLAELKSADSQFHMHNYAEAQVLYEEFEERHPTNEAIPYIMFQIGLCHYLRIGTIDRDTSGAASAIQALSRLLRAYPDSPYTDEARARIEAANNFLANHEYYVADFYTRTKAYPEAESRLVYLLSQYPQSEVAPQAQALLDALRAGKPPGRNWLAWLPELSMPDWRPFSRSKVEAGEADTE